MNKKEYNFELWCRDATERIHYKPDRKQVHAELRAHLEDAYDAHIEHGLSPDEAEQKALESMGRASQVAAQLAAVHSPFWAYVIQASQIALVVLLILSLIPIYKYIGSLHLSDAPSLRDFDIYNAASYGEGTGRVLHHLSEPDVSFSSEAGRFTATDAAVFTTFSDDAETSRTQLYVLVQQRSLLPWKEHEEYSPRISSTSWFSARDSLGNAYPSYWDPYLDGTPHLYSRDVQSGIFTGTHQFWINDFPQDAQWVEILYTLDGREYVLHIDLTGGDRT